MELYNIEAEQIILGAIIQNNEYFYKVNDLLKPEHFYEELHNRIYSHLQNKIKNGEKVDSVILKGFFETDSVLKTIGGVNYLSTLLGQATGIFDVNNYAKLIVELWVKRRCSDMATDLLNVVQTDKNSIEILNSVRTEIENMQDNTGFEYNAKTIYEIVLSEIPRIKENMQNKTSSRLKTGLKDFDEQFYGFKDGELVIFGGRPSMGKSTIASQIALNVAERGKNVIFFSEEMSNEINAYRTIANITKVNSYKFEQGFINDDNLKLLEQRVSTLKDTKLYIDDKTSITPAYMEKTLRRLHRKLKRIDLIVIDYLQFTKSDGNEKDIRHILSDITKKLKELAKKYNCPVLCLSQLNREVDKRDNKRPEMFDLRDSGTIEEDADMVIFCYRGEYYASKRLASLNEYSSEAKERKEYLDCKNQLTNIKNTCELLVRKNRNGACGTATINYLQEFFIAY